jgi:hypothetical protein
MKKILIYSVFFLSLLIACRKQEQPPPPPAKQTPVNTKATLTLAEVKAWYHADSTSAPDWTKAEKLIKPTGEYWLVPLSGQPTFQLVKQGYRKAAFFRDSSSHIRERILEIIPDGLSLQRGQKTSPERFTGRLFVYDPHYRLLAGRVYAQGKQVGVIKKQDKQTQGLQTYKQQTIFDCSWAQSHYIDGNGEVVIYAEQNCTATTYDDGTIDGTGFESSPGEVAGHTGSGSGGDAADISPPPSNLPGEDQPRVDPKELVICFGSIPDQGATMQVTVYVQEPFPGTFFNIGPNSVGHTAIGLTKTNGSSTVTQVIGFYPDASGIAKMHAPSKIVNNGGDLQYNVSITYTVSADDFNKITSYIASPPGTYDLMEFNCTSFVFYACLKGNITLPDPVSTVGLGGPGVVSTAMTPAGLGSSIAALKDQSNVNQQGGNTPNSKGPCH